MRTRYLLAIDIVCILIALSLAVLLRYESLTTTYNVAVARWPLAVVDVVARIAISFALGLYSRIWRYASLREGFRIFIAVTLGSAVLFLFNWTAGAVAFMSPVESVSVFVLDWVFNLIFLAASRLSLRVGLSWLVNHQKRELLSAITPHKRVLIAGAGDMGSVVTRLITDNPEMGYELVGYVDDDPNKQGQHLHGSPVLGTRTDIPTLAKEHRIEEVIVAISTAPQSAIDDFRRICTDARIPFRVIPSIYHLLAGSLSIEQIRQWRSHETVVEDNGFRSKALATLPIYHSIMVTGGAGFIGSNFVRHMLNTYPNYMIIVYDKLTYAGNPDNLAGLREEFPDRYVFVKGDIADYDQVALAMKMYGIDAIVNFAAESHVDRSLMDPGGFLDTNITGAYTLLEAARQFEIKRFHQVSTDEVYGQVMRGSFSENDPLETRSPYSASKAGADLLVYAYFNSFGVAATITRGSNNIGPYQYPEKAVPLFVTSALDNLPLPVYGDGLYIRDYQYVLDHCRGIDTVLHKGTPGETYNLGGGPENERTTLDLARGILDRLGKPHSLIHLVTDRPGQDRRYSLNCSKIKTLGWEPEWPFEKALDATVQWYIDNEPWWRKIKSGEYRQYYEKQFTTRLEEAVQRALTKSES